MVNKVLLIGYLADVPVVTATTSGKKVAKMRIGTNERHKDQSGQYQTTTEWHNLVMFDKTAEIASQYLTKGAQVYIEGKIKYNTYEKDGQKKYFTEIIVNEFKMLGKKESSGNNDGGNDAQSNYSAPASNNNAPAKGNKGNASNTGNNNATANQNSNKGQNQQQPTFVNNSDADTDSDLPF
jgi:single-strand DNA-binding protein